MARLLIIDDEALVRRALRRILEGAGHQVTEAADGAAGMAAYLSDPQDLVICDMVMPVQDGLSTLRHLLAAFPAVKFIAMSGGCRTSAGSLLDIAAWVGARMTLDKPLSKATVLDAVRVVLSGA
ncbi:MAG: response regulator [Kofleriaceae bacterium]